MSRKKKKLLVTGASGLLGSNLMYCLKDQYEMCGLYHSHKIFIDGVSTRLCDLRQKADIKHVIDDFCPDIVIHCAAQADVEKCESDPDLTKEVNIGVTKHIAEILSGSKIKLIYISSDLIYGGVKGNFSENDSAGPLNIYAQSKLDGEREALKLKGSLALRTNFFGWNVHERESLGEWVINGLKANRPIRGFTDTQFSSIYTFDLARIIDKIIQKDLSGIYNLGSKGSLSKNNFALTIADKLNLNASLVVPISIDEFGFKAKRGKNLSLDISKLEHDINTVIPSIEESIDHFARDSQTDLPDTFKSFGRAKKIYPQLSHIAYGRQSIDEEDIQSVVAVLKSSNLTQGPKVAEFEQKLCKQTGARFAVAVNSGTSALHIACLAAGVQKGDEGVTSANTFVASANCIVFCGGKPVFGDIDSRTYNILPSEIEKITTKKTKVVIPVHFAGQSCDMEAIKQVVASKEKKYGNKIMIIEDAAHALGSKYNGYKVGSCRYSDMTIMSFHPVKHITTGEGGVVLTNDKDLCNMLKKLRSHGITNSTDELKNTSHGMWYYEQQYLGFNYRMTDIQSALGISQLNKLPGFIKRRREIADFYNQQFKNIVNIRTPFEALDCESNFHLYVLLFHFLKIGKTRSECMNEFKRHGIRTQVHYIPIVMQPFYQKEFGTNLKDYLNTQNYYDQCLSIPLYPGMRDEEIKHVVDSIKRFIA